MSLPLSRRGRTRALDPVARIAAAAVDAPLALVALHEGARLRVHGALGLPDLAETEAGFPPDDPLLQALARSGMQRVDDVDREPAIAGSRLMRPLGASSCAVVPLELPNEDPLGILWVGDVRTRGWEPGEVARLADIASLARAAARWERTSRPAREVGVPERRGSGAESVLDRIREELKTPDRVCDTLRRSIAASLHLEELHPGDRLPSVREVAHAMGVGRHVVQEAYRTLAGEGSVERRPRSGMYAAAPEGGGPELRSETPRWMAGVVTQAYERQLPIPLLPDLVRAWTGALPLRCACVGSDGDNLAAIRAEMERIFGLEGIEVPVRELSGQAPRSLRETGTTPDLVVATAWDAHAAQRLAAELARPLVVLTVNPETVQAVEHHLRSAPLTVVCADPRFGERILALRGGMYRDRVRVVRADDQAAVAALDPQEPVLLTWAARQRLGDVHLRLVAAHFPAFSPESVRRLAEVIVGLNLAAQP